MKAVFSVLLVFILPLVVYTQELYALKSGKVGFFAGTPIEDIDAVNTKPTSFFNIKTGEVVISMRNTDFTFKRALMQEHFNENYMESEKYPKSEFKGKVLNINALDLSVSGEYTVEVEGNFTIHGVTKPRKIDVVIVNKDGMIKADSKFQVLLDDHKIERPQIVWEKLAETVQVTLSLSYEIFKK